MFLSMFLSKQTHISVNGSMLHTALCQLGLLPLFMYLVLLIVHRVKEKQVNSICHPAMASSSHLFIDPVRAIKWDENCSERKCKGCVMLDSLID